MDFWSSRQVGTPKAKFRLNWTLLTKFPSGILFGKEHINANDDADSDSS